MPLREEGAKEEGAVAQNIPFSSTSVVLKACCLSYISMLNFCYVFIEIVECLIVDFKLI